ncbi:metal-dependent transcriptional regulator [Salana multivorans]
MVTEDVGRVAEDYLALIWKANEWPGDERRATTSDLAAALGVTLSTVSANLKRLARERLIRYQPYGAIELTREGERIALGVVRRHRLIETFLVEQLCYSWDEVHEEADRLEHAVTD